jgi:hypothetical protein
MELVSPKIFNKFRRSITKNGIGDNASLKGIRLNGKVYFRRICEDCYFKKRNKKLPKCNILSYEFGELLKISEAEDNTPSCSLAEALEKQDLFINSTLAQMGSSLLWSLFRNGMTENRGFFLNLKEFKTQPIKL